MQTIDGSACRHCGATVPPKPPGSRGPAPLYCTRRCRNKAKHTRTYVPRPPRAVAQRRFKHQPGARFGALVLIERLPASSGTQYALCRCDCGTRKRVGLQNLATGAITNCADRTHHPDPRRKEALTYGGAHSRVKNERGSASLYRCRCGRQAEQWAYSHADYDAASDAVGREAGKPFSTDSAHYMPMCRSCHSLFDHARHRMSGGGLSLVHVAFWMVSH